jgi:hypothetical protein
MQVHLRVICLVACGLDMSGPLTLGRVYEDPAWCAAAATAVRGLLTCGRSRETVAARAAASPCATTSAGRTRLFAGTFCSSSPMALRTDPFRAKPVR